MTAGLTYRGDNALYPALEVRYLLRQGRTGGNRVTRMEKLRR